MRGTSSPRTTTSGRERTSSVTRRANRSRSTASAFPAGTLSDSASRTRGDPRIRNSSFRSTFPEVASSDPSELLHTSSANQPVRCAGVGRSGRISKSSTAMPASESRRAASEPASPAPTTVILPSAIPGYLPLSFRGRGKEHRERASLPGDGAYLDEPLVIVNDPLGDGEPEAGPPLLRGEEGIEDLREILRGDPRAGI